MNLKEYKHIIWDWNGTIFDDVNLCLDIINGVLTRRSLPALTLNSYRDIFTFPVQNYYAKAGLDFDKCPFAQLGQEWMNEYEARKVECRLHTGIENTLVIINEAGVKQSILSAYSRHTLEELVKHFNLKKYFTHIAGLDHIYATSKLELGMELIKKLGNGKSKVLLIGDTEHDYEVAQAMGADCILIAEGHQSKQKLKGCGVEVFSSIRDLLKHLS